MVIAPVIAAAAKVAVGAVVKKAVKEIMKG